MRVAVSASGPTLDSQVDPRFGRCAYFVVVDTGTMAAEAIENASVAAAQGAGIATAQMIAGKGVAAVCSQGTAIPGLVDDLAAAAGIEVEDPSTKKAGTWALGFDGETLAYADYYVSPLPVL